MKKILIFCLLLFLVSCENDTQSVKPISYNTSSSQVIVECEEESYYVHNDLLPNYAIVKSYPSELLMDYDVTTSVKYDVGNHLFFEFTQEEKLCAIEISSENLNEIKLFVNGQAKTYHENEIIINESVETLTFEILEETDISEIRFITEKKVSTKEYNEFSYRLEHINQLMDYDWQDNPIENLSVLETTTIAKDIVLSVAGPADFYRLRDHKAYGYPTIIRGQIIDQIDDYLIVSSITDEEKIKLYTNKKYKTLEFIEICAIYIGYDEYMFFREFE